MYQVCSASDENIKHHPQPTHPPFPLFMQGIIRPGEVFGTTIVALTTNKGKACCCCSGHGILIVSKYNRPAPIDLLCIVLTGVVSRNYSCSNKALIARGLQQQHTNTMRTPTTAFCLVCGVQQFMKTYNQFSSTYVYRYDKQLKKSQHLTADQKNVKIMCVRW